MDILANLERSSNLAVLHPCRLLVEIAMVRFTPMNVIFCFGGWDYTVSGWASMWEIFFNGVEAPMIHVKFGEPNLDFQPLLIEGASDNVEDKAPSAEECSVVQGIAEACRLVAFHFVLSAANHVCVKLAVTSPHTCGVTLALIRMMLQKRDRKWYICNVPCCVRVRLPVSTAGDLRFQSAQTRTEKQTRTRESNWANVWLQIVLEQEDQQQITFTHKCLIINYNVHSFNVPFPRIVPGSPLRLSHSQCNPSPSLSLSTRLTHMKCLHWTIRPPSSHQVLPHLTIRQSQLSSDATQSI